MSVESVIHLAALNSLECEKDPNLAEKINSVGTLNVLDSAKKNGVKFFLYFSTAHVYGSDLDGVIDENSPINLTNSYSSSHKLAEEFVLSFNALGRINTCVFRLTNVIGSPLNENTNCWMLIANDLCKKIAANQKPELYANKLIVRDFIPITDVINSTFYYLNHKDNKFGGEIINISSSKPKSLEYLCNLLVNRSAIILNKHVVIKYNNLIQEKTFKEYCISNKKAISFGLTFKNQLLDEVDLMLMKYEKWFNKN